MYNGTNPTALRSQEWLCKAFLALLKEKSYENINVISICRKADLSRMTFYQFFSSKEELLRCCIRRELKELGTIPESDDFSVIAKYFAEHIERCRPFIQLIFLKKIDHFFVDELSQKLTDFANRVDPNRDPKITPIANAFLSAGLAKALMIWSVSPDILEEELTRFLSDLVHGSYFKWK